MPRSEETAGDRRMRHLYWPRAIPRRRPYDLHKWSFGAGPLFSISAGPTPGIRARHPSVRGEPPYPGSGWRDAAMDRIGGCCSGTYCRGEHDCDAGPRHVAGPWLEGLASYYAEAG